MEDQFNEQAGVEDASVAGEQVEETTVVQDESGAEGDTEVAAQVKDEKDFSTALKAREAQLRKQLEREYEPHRRHSQYLERLAKSSGYDDTEGFLEAVEQVEEQQRIDQASQKMGIDENTYRQYFQPVDQRLRAYESELDSLRLDRAKNDVQAKLTELSTKYGDFDKYQGQVFELALSRGYDLEDAYRLASYEDKLSSIGQQKEQEVLARVTGRDQKQVLSSTDKPSNVNFDPANMSLKDIEEISKRVQRGERITL